MSAEQWLGLGIFTVGYAVMLLEHTLKTRKAPIALCVGAGLWLHVRFNVAHADTLLEHAIVSAADVVFFLLPAMTLVEILVSYQFFNWLRTRLFRLNFRNKQQFVAITGGVFIASAVIDNLTATLVGIKIATQFFKRHNLLLAIIAVVIAANAGGAGSPIGDVTTFMLWVAGKFTAGEIISWGMPPSLVMLLVLLGMMTPSIRNITAADDNPEELVDTLPTGSWIVIGCLFATFLLPFGMVQIGLPPFLGLMLGLGITVGGVVPILRAWSPPDELETSLDLDLEHLLRKLDIESLLFFIGILLAADALDALGVLTHLSHMLFGAQPSVASLIGGSIVLGAVSAILDNIPLTAVAIDMLSMPSPTLWSLLALAVGTGGSMLPFGSAAGVVAMGQSDQLKNEGRVDESITLGTWIKYGTKPAATSFAAGCLTWSAMYYLWG